MGFVPPPLALAQLPQGALGIGDDVVHKVEQGQHHHNGEQQHGGQGDEHGHGQVCQGEEVPQEEQRGHKAGEQHPEQGAPQAVEGGAHLKEHDKARQAGEDYRQGGHIRVGKAQGLAEGTQQHDVGGHGQGRRDALADDV